MNGFTRNDGREVRFDSLGERWSEESKKGLILRFQAICHPHFLEKLYKAERIEISAEATGELEEVSWPVSKWHPQKLTPTMVPTYHIEAARLNGQRQYVGIYPFLGVAIPKDKPEIGVQGHTIADVLGIPYHEDRPPYLTNVIEGSVHYILPAV